MGPTDSHFYKTTTANALESEPPTKPVKCGKALCNGNDTGEAAAVKLPAIAAAAATLAAHANHTPPPAQPVTAIKAHSQCEQMSSSGRRGRQAGGVVLQSYYA
ncbi:hypothetical protein CVT26_011936 [Gymnopilus dilepis]|uniref:Uncharacterized protein n=1 Tax=Gymnopilus dilepis TaxID=231916 RepID=A0A409WWZ8_9AGAR|nr:hypothetical protein CVT26_011936 [Gymnopilus dilepis]